ncbi:MAG: AAA family ATPase [Candidatus Anaerobiospirillum pullicola]|uniref:AAA family ATPase n=1 Tax=Candidatus Anaerobiospirillum pullicola TaxID=2838451 RepID=A0A948TGT2_9GAMM|nr:AAA family ATPase [Candidatus Anaerobiospirillum pullicola]
MLKLKPLAQLMQASSLGGTALQDSSGDDSDLQNIPLGVSHWDDLQDKFFDYVVVDKTAKLAELVKYNAVFIGRPRRMGKTTLCSMLYELFAHGKGKFEDTAVYELWTEPDVYPVIRLSFNVIGGDDVSQFEAALKDAVVNAFCLSGFPEVKSFQRDMTISGFLGQFNQIALQHELVILIDEWDRPLTRLIDNNDDNADKFNVVRSVLSVFYAWLRVVPNVRFTLVTGIMRYSEFSPFTGQDIQDLSMEPYWADLLGYTQEDVRTYFARYILLATKKLGISEEQLFEKLELYYAGFCFDENASVKVYCPYAINSFFDQLTDPDKQLMFDSFWMESACAREALTSFLSTHPLAPTDLSQICLQHFTLTKDELREPFFFGFFGSGGSVKFKQLLVQGGYYSIKSLVHNPVTGKREFNCGVTNQDVVKDFEPVVTNYLVNFDADKSKALKAYGAAAQQSLLAGDFECMCIRLNQILGKIHSQILNHADEELYRAFIARFLRANLIKVSAEVVNTLGRCDLVAVTPDRLYPIELKCLSADKDTEHHKFTRLTDGDTQLLEKGYGSNLTDNDLPQTGVILVISDKDHQICAWRTLTQTDAGIEHHEGYIPPLNVLTQQQVKYGRVHWQSQPQTPSPTQL